MGRTRYRFTAPSLPHFLTCTVVEWLPVFNREETACILLDSWRFLIHHRGLRLYGYVILENHLHAVAQAPDLPKTWHAFKTWTARATLQHLERQGYHHLLRRLHFACRSDSRDRIHRLWQEGSHPQVIEHEAVLRQKLEYIHHNPVKRGYVESPEHWRWSSARDYADRPGPVEVYREWMGERDKG